MIHSQPQLMDVDLAFEQVPECGRSHDALSCLNSMLEEDTAIEANDIGSLLEQFLEYEEVHGDIHELEKELDFLTPATSPRCEKPKLEDLIEDSIQQNGIFDSALLTGLCGPTPPLTPTSDDSPSKSVNYPQIVFDVPMIIQEEVVITTEQQQPAETTFEQPDVQERVKPMRKRIPKTYRKRKRSRSPAKPKRSKQSHRSRSRSRHQQSSVRQSSISSNSSGAEDDTRISSRDDHASMYNVQDDKSCARHCHAEYEDEFGRFHAKECACSRCQRRMESDDHTYGVGSNSRLSKPSDELQDRLAVLSSPVPYDIERERKVDFLIRPEERLNSKNERRNMYVGRIPQQTTKDDLRRKFELFGPIEKVSLHFREKCDSYAFVVFYYPEDAAKAIECGATDESCAGLDLCFGGRRKFVGGSYVDFDGNVSYLEENVRPAGLEEEKDLSPESDFDRLLNMAKKQQQSTAHHRH